MKKAIAVLLALCLSLLTLAACGEKQESPAATAPSGTDKPVEEVRNQLTITGSGPSINCDLDAKENYTIAMIVKNSTNPGQLQQLKGCAKAGADAGCTILQLSPATNDSVEEQVTLVEDCIQQGVDGIVIHCADSNGIMPGVLAAEEAGIPVITVGTPSAEETLMRSGCDYYNSGQVMAEYVAKHLNQKGEVIVLEGAPGAQNAKERAKGIADTLAKYSDMKIVASQTANWKRAEGLSVTENLLQAHPDVSVIFGCNDEMALGAYQALLAAGKQDDCVVVGFDGNKDCSYAIQAGEILASYNTDSYGAGYTCIMYMIQYLNDGAMPPQYFVPYPDPNGNAVVDASNIDQFIKDVWES